MNNIRRTALWSAILLAPVFAGDTKVWQQVTMADFEKGTINKLSLSSEGRLSVAPALKELFDPSVTFLWSVARDSKGNVYTGGGSLGASKAKLFVLDSSGRSRTLAELDGMAIQAIAVDASDRVYAATSPDGKVYRVDASGSVQTYYDPQQKYIWALAFAKSGDLFVATGDQGEIHRVTPAGAGSLFFKTEETHARSLAVDASGNLIVGTDPSGLVVRVTPAGEGFVLYQTAKREVTAVAVAPDGTLFAAAAGNRSTPAAPPPPPQPVAVQAPANAQAAAAARPPAVPPPTLAIGTQAVTGGSDLYHLQPDGYARKVWSNAQDVVYALAIDEKGRALAGTGNRGLIYRIDDDHVQTRLHDVAPTQVTGLASGPDGRIFVATGNVGKLFSLGREVETSGTLESDVLDTGAFSYWGRLMLEPEDAKGITLETRSGNLSRPQQNWSKWEKLSPQGRVASPAARFVQYRATLTGAAEMTEIDLAYQMKNVAPAVDQVEITPANYKFPAPSAAPSSGPQATLTLPPLGRAAAPASLTISDASNFPALNWAKGQTGARWLSSDDNGDTLIYKVEIRGVNEQTWKLVRDKIRERYANWDSTAYPDGKYVVRVTASDAPSNPPDQALTASRETDPFLIDNTPPEVTNLTSAAAGAKLEIRFKAKDALSWIEKAEYSINGGEWLVVQPTTRLTDSQEHEYRVQVDRPQGEVTIAVRVADEFDNQAVAKTVVR